MPINCPADSYSFSSIQAFVWLGKALWSSNVHASNRVWHNFKEMSRHMTPGRCLTTLYLPRIRRFDGRPSICTAQTVLRQTVAPVESICLQVQACSSPES